MKRAAAWLMCAALAACATGPQDDAVRTHDEAIAIAIKACAAQDYRWGGFWQARWHKSYWHVWLANADSVDHPVYVVDVDAHTGKPYDCGLWVR